MTAESIEDRPRGLSSSFSLGPEMTRMVELTISAKVCESLFDARSIVAWFVQPKEGNLRGTGRAVLKTASTPQPASIRHPHDEPLIEHG